MRYIGVLLFDAMEAAAFGQYFVLALLPLAFPSGVWLLKLWLVERYVFLYGDKASR